MSTYQLSTFYPSGKDLAGSRKWYIVDAAGKPVGRIATEIARILSGKNNPMYTPFMDVGDNVVVINAKSAIFKGSRAEQKVYHHHTLYPGGLRTIGVKDQFAKHPERVIELAVKGMLPKNKLGKAMAKKLHVYGDAAHRHEAQNPQPLEIKTK